MSIVPGHVGAGEVAALRVGGQTHRILDVLGSHVAVLQAQLLALIDERHPGEGGEHGPDRQRPGPTEVAAAEAGDGPVLVVAGYRPGETLRRGARPRSDLVDESNRVPLGAVEAEEEIGRASCRERGWMAVGDVADGAKSAV